jgi:hypothetical protein
MNAKTRNRKSFAMNEPSSERASRRAMGVVYSNIVSAGQSSISLKNPRRPRRVWNKLTVARLIFRAG